MMKGYAPVNPSRLDVGIRGDGKVVHEASVYWQSYVGIGLGASCLSFSCLDDKVHAHNEQDN